MPKNQDKEVSFTTERAVDFAEKLGAFWEVNAGNVEELSQVCRELGLRDSQDFRDAAETFNGLSDLFNKLQRKESVETETINTLLASLMEIDQHSESYFEAMVPQEAKTAKKETFENKSNEVTCEKTYQIKKVDYDSVKEPRDKFHKKLESLLIALEKMMGQENDHGMYDHEPLARELSGYSTYLSGHIEPTNAELEPMQSCTAERKR